MVGDDIAIVIIGRNEGERLRRCLRSVTGFGTRIYVDSGSTDGSQDFARSLGFTVLDLDDGFGFTAARARNLGIFHLAEHHPQIGFVQTVDGDCEIVSGWALEASARMRKDHRLAVVFGRRRERFPGRNIYHRACEIEWNVPAGPANSCGGDALFRLSALVEADGFNPRLVSGEEPDLCYRLRLAGWTILSDGRDMTLHDVDISSLRQWWRRALRAGHGIAELVAIHGSRADRGWNRFLSSAYVWSAILLLTSALLLASIILTSPWLLAAAIALALLAGVQILRIGQRARGDFPSSAQATKWGALLLFSKVAQAQGALLYWRRRLTSSRRTIIEYK
jgi:GT2 family glycosyltransferase